MADASATSDADLLSGRLHVYVAFDWGEEIDLERARQRGAGVVLDMMRRSRTPASIAYRPPPLRFPLRPVSVEMPGLTGSHFHTAEATIFDFAGVSLALRLPFSLPRRELYGLAARLTEQETARSIMLTARAILHPLFVELTPAIKRPAWEEDLWEEYFVFQFPPCDA